MRVVAPVPPRATATVVNPAPSEPLVSVPTLVSELLTMPLPSVLPFSTEVPLM